MKLLLSVLLLAALLPAHADSIEQHWSKVCKKMQQCTLAQIEKMPDGLPEGMREQVKASLNSACDHAKEDVTAGIDKANSEQKQAVIACMKSLQQASCEQLIDGEGSTAACEKLEQYQ